MNAEFVRRAAMQYRDQEFRYESAGDDLEIEVVRQQVQAKQYRTKRSSRTARRRVPKVAHPGYGISGRRNRRFAW